MPRLSNFSGSKTIYGKSITQPLIVDFLAPLVHETGPGTLSCLQSRRTQKRWTHLFSSQDVEACFFSAISRLARCDNHYKSPATERDRQTSLERVEYACKAGIDNGFVPCSLGSEQPKNETHGLSPQRNSDRSHLNTRKRNIIPTPPPSAVRDLSWIVEKAASWKVQDKARSDVIGIRAACTVFTRPPEKPWKSTQMLGKTLPLKNGKMTMLRPRTLRQLHTKRQLSASPPTAKRRQEQFAKDSHLPRNFFDDISALERSIISSKGVKTYKTHESKTTIRRILLDHHSTMIPDDTLKHDDLAVSNSLDEHIKLLNSVRELENKLERAKKDLAQSLSHEELSSLGTTGKEVKQDQVPVVLTKEDYKNLVDLYYYSHNSRFSPQSTDASPTPVILNDYSFTLSADFSPGGNSREEINEDEIYESPLRKIDEMLRRRQLREVAVMQVFVDLLLDDGSSNRALYEAYKQLPDPGVAYLPKGVIRLFLQRMSTPWTRSEKSMLRYLSLIDDMQRAELPITQAEWSSAIYLAGRSFRSVTDQDLNNSLQTWQTMEREAGVQASHVTFNILFDIAVRSGRFALCETILKEMHSRNLRLNRLGRVSLMYYHGLRRDGDGVRKVYRDFVDAGEIVDTLVLNCVIASLFNADEPQAAEQIYARMKNLQTRLRRGAGENNGETLFQRYPDPGGSSIDLQMASNHLGRVLENAPKWRANLPDHHKKLQDRMPLTPDHITFRSMIAYHATTSGDLDRITVLLQDMTDQFDLPLLTTTFQLLFKGFAIHGPVGGPRSAWSIQRLDLCWKACRAALADSIRNTSSVLTSTDRPIPNDRGTLDDSRPPPKMGLPSITEVNATPYDNLQRQDSPNLSRPPPRRLSDWSEFVLDLAAFPRERLKRLERFHSTMFDAEDSIEPRERPGVHTFSSPYFQSNAYTAPEPNLDREEGEYTLPTPSGSGLVSQSDRNPEQQHSNQPMSQSEFEPVETDEVIASSHKVYATRALICWLLRAYARITKSRSKVEEIYGSVRKVYKPQDMMEKESVIRVLRRCLRDCDREAGD